MAELEINVVTEGGDAAGPSENPTLVVSDYSLIHHTDYSNTIIAQNANNASVVSIFPLRDNETEAVQTTQPVTAPQVANTPISTGGSAY
tara:strand:- start:285 stop:551 length:267 start_codon:yes stop_codon:yes gene_type:complete